MKPFFKVKSDMSPRNVELFKARRRGATFVSLAAKYGISQPRASQIYYRQELIERRLMKLSLNAFFDAASIVVMRHGHDAMNDFVSTRLEP